MKGEKGTGLSVEQGIEIGQKRDERRFKLDILFLVLLACWFIFIAFMVLRVDMSVYEGLGLGTVTGVLLKCLADMWQFYHRKS